MDQKVDRMHYLPAIGHTGLVAILQYPLRSTATIGCVLAILVPYLAGLGLSKGVQEQAEASVDLGADLYLTTLQVGREVPIPVAMAGEIQKIDGVRQVAPRIVTRVVLGKNHEEAVLVGLPVERFPASVTCVEGELPHASTLNELVVG